MKIGVRICYSRTFCICKFYKNIKRILFQQTMLSHEYFRDLLKLLCKGICYALLTARSRLCLASKISTPTGRILEPNLASMCITPF